jgi:hypothetical protein
MHPGLTALLFNLLFFLAEALALTGGLAVAATHDRTRLWTAAAFVGAAGLLTQ